MLLLLQAALIAGYAVLAHLGTAWRHDGMALAAMGCLALMALAPALAQRRAWAWALLPPLAAGAWWLHRHGHAAVPLLLAPVLFTGLIGWVFGRSLVRGRVPLITRIVAGLDRVPPDALAPALRVYTRRLTAAWAGLLWLLAAINLALALLASPDGLLAHAGLPSPWPITTAQWSWFANLSNYGVIGGFMLAEFQLRKRRFPGLETSFVAFLRRMAGLGPAFWRDLLR